MSRCGEINKTFKLAKRGGTRPPAPSLLTSEGVSPDTCDVQFQDVCSVVDPEAIDMSPDSVLRTLATLFTPLKGDYAVASLGANSRVLLPNVLVKTAKTVPVKLVVDADVPISTFNCDMMPMDSIEDRVTCPVDKRVKKIRCFLQSNLKAWDEPLQQLMYG